MKGESVGRSQYDFIQYGKGERSNLSPFIFCGHRGPPLPVFILVHLWLLLRLVSLGDTGASPLHTDRL